MRPNQPYLLAGITLLACLLATSPFLPAQAADKPNVLFLAVDDMKDWVNCLGGYEGTVHTPNIDRLAEQGVLFTNAHCPSPKCAPSRAAIMTGLMPSTTGLYENSHWWLPNLPDVVTIPAHFRANGYDVAGAGKIFHHTAGNHPPNQWDEFQRITFRNDGWMRDVKSNYPWSVPLPNPAGFPYSEVEGLGHENDWGSLPITEAEYDDALSVDFAVKFLSNRKRQSPFFLACGLFRPHLPWYVPEKYFEMYPLEEIVLPTVPEDDLADIPYGGLKLAKAGRNELNKIKEAGKWRHAIQAYLASITFADAQLGRVLDELDAGPYQENTIVMLWSDHGWHLGEKDHWHKTTLWEEATRVPFIISAPGYAKGRCDRSVSLVDIYPTLNELCGLPKNEAHDGISLAPLLRDPQAERSRPAVIEYKKGNAAVRSDRYRYIRYQDGGLELYDLENDPNEWNNLATAETKQSAELIEPLEKWLPPQWAEPAPTKSRFSFDYQKFEWKDRKTGAVISGMDAE